ncbi:MAG: preprotein translocase subunit SecG [Candidatus Kapaibacterium sp.]
MFWVILILALILSIMLIVMVLLQPSKGGGITAAFGGIGGTIGSTFGQRRTLEALGKWTTYFAIGIAVLCLIANLFFLPVGSSDGGSRAVTTGGIAPSVTPAPGATPAPTGETGAAGESSNSSTETAPESPPAGNDESGK